MAFIPGDSTANTLNGTTGADTISGGNGADRIAGDGGDDAIYGFGAADEAANAGAIGATRVATGFAGAVFLTSAPGDPSTVFVVQKDAGLITRFDPDTGVRSTFLDVPDTEFSGGGEGGVLGLAFHPQYASNGKFYVFLTTPGGDLEVREYTRSAADPTVADLATARTILTVPHPNETNHNGGSLAFSPTDGYLYITTGDGGGGGDPGENAQNTNSLLGKILRIDVDGDSFPSDPTRNYAIPSSNPFVGVAGADEIWAFGLRNPWRVSFDALTGDLYIGDVGEGQVEEIDFQPAGAGGRNYGWDIKEGTLPFEPGQPGEPPIGDPSLINPVFEYGRSLGQSVTGGYVYRGPESGVQGTYFFADFLSGRFWTLRIENGVAVDVVERTSQIVSATGPISLISSFGVDGNGNLYALTISGNIFRLSPTSGSVDVADRLSGDAGSDRLYGGIGNDTLIGDGAVLPTANAASIYRLNLATLDRAPTAAEHIAETAQLDAGATLTSVASGLVNSRAFFDAYPANLSTTAFVTLLYNNVLDRAPDAGGLANWINAINAGMSREQAVLGFSESPEFKLKSDTGDDYGQIYRLYGATLDRTPDAAGFQSWADEFYNGTSLATAANEFVGSAEFQLTYGSTLTNSQFVTLLYSNVLDRAPDAGGLANWVTLLASGASRAAVVTGFSESAEYQNTTNAAFDAFMRTGVPAWSDTIDGGAGNDQLSGDRGADTFVFRASQGGSDHVYGLEAWDALQFNGFGYSSSAAALARMTTSGADVVFSDQGETITFHDTTLSKLSAVTYAFG